MGSKPKQKMPVADRAKQFMPFSALKGLEDALAAKERQIVDKKELSEDGAELLSRKLSEMKIGDFARITYFSDGEYISCDGRVTKIDEVYKEITVVKTVIPIEDIYDIVLGEKTNEKP